jgi:hypothetical protein
VKLTPLSLHVDETVSFAVAQDFTATTPLAEELFAVAIQKHTSSRVEELVETQVPRHVLNRLLNNLMKVVEPLEPYTLEMKDDQGWI